MKLTYLRHSAIIIEEGKFKGIIDPYISDNPIADVNAFGVIKADPFEYKNKVKTSEVTVLNINESLNI